VAERPVYSKALADWNSLGALCIEHISPEVHMYRIKPWQQGITA
jgi:hypothetical protein